MSITEREQKLIDALKLVLNTWEDDLSNQMPNDEGNFDNAYDEVMVDSESGYGNVFNQAYNTLKEFEQN